MRIFTLVLAAELPAGSLPAAQPESSGIYCVQRGPEGLIEPQDLPALLTCQVGTRSAFHDSAPDETALERWLIDPRTDPDIALRASSSN